MNWSSSIFRRKEHCSPTKEKEFKSCKVFFTYKKVTSSREQFHGLNEDFSVQKQKTDCIRPESNCISLLVTAYLPLFPLSFVLKKNFRGKKKKKERKSGNKKEVLKRHTLVNLFNLLKKIQGVEIPREQKSEQWAALKVPSFCSDRKTKKSNKYEKWICLILTKIIAVDVRQPLGCYHKCWICMKLLFSWKHLFVSIGLEGSRSKQSIQKKVLKSIFPDPSVKQTLVWVIVSPWCSLWEGQLTTLCPEHKGSIHFS